MADSISFSAVASTHLRYHRWATNRMLEFVHGLTEGQIHEDLKTSHKTLFGMLGHMYQAEAVWWARLQGDAEHSQLSLIKVPETLAALEQIWKPMLDGYVNWARSEPDWAMDLCYSNSAGQEFRNPVWQVIMHLVSHASQHRGQIVGMVRQLGGTPQGTDPIVYYRLGCPD